MPWFDFVLLFAWRCGMVKKPFVRESEWTRLTTVWCCFLTKRTHHSTLVAEPTTQAEAAEDLEQARGNGSIRGRQNLSVEKQRGLAESSTQDHPTLIPKSFNKTKKRALRTFTDLLCARPFGRWKPFQEAANGRLSQGAAREAHPMEGVSGRWSYVVSTWDLVLWGVWMTEAS